MDGIPTWNWHSRIKASVENGVISTWEGGSHSELGCYPCL
jgi:hypothetical protein